MSTPHNIEVQPARAARIPLEHPRSLFMRLMEAYSRRKYGAVLHPGLAIAHNRKVLWSMIRNEAQVARWNALDPTLKALAVLAVSAEIGCSWCLDFGYWESISWGVEAHKLRAINEWRTSPVYTDLERQVIEYAITATQTPPEVTDEMVARLRKELSDAELVELTAMIGLENSRSRTNAALGLSSQGFKDSCELPPADLGMADRGIADRGIVEA
jgi:alkylhydroperoxidase family enzyme